MKIAILGCGWLGFPLGKNLVAKGHQVVGSVTSEAKTIPLSEAGIQPVVLQLNPEANEAILSDF
jgi:3-hydroxyisobutyrate dehydrogenase-like beta-hydroxyacid dehydrogenase